MSIADPFARLTFRARLTLQWTVGFGLLLAATGTAIYSSAGAASGAAAVAANSNAITAATGSAGGQADAGGGPQPTIRDLMTFGPLLDDYPNVANAPNVMSPVAVGVTAPRRSDRPSGAH